jgi:hypothetical protein
MKKHNNSNKRIRNGTDSDSEIDDRNAVKDTLPNAWPRFLLVEGTDPDRPLSKLSPFATKKWIEGISTQITNVKRIKDGALLVEAPSEKISTWLLNRSGTMCVDRPIKVSIHKTLNSSKGVIRSRELEGMSEEEIVGEMRNQGVIGAHRVTMKKGVDHVPTNTYFLTFCVPKVPEVVHIGYLRVRVQLFVPSPMRCFQCHRFGHPSKYCKASPACVKCGKESHDDDCVAKCINCQGGHSANSKDCPKWRLEAEIQKVRAEQGLSFGDAKRAVQGSENKATYSEKASTENASKSSSNANVSASSTETLIKTLCELISTLTKKVDLLEAKLDSLVIGNTQAAVSKAVTSTPQSLQSSSSESRIAGNSDSSAQQVVERTEPPSIVMSVVSTDDAMSGKTCPGSGQVPSMSVSGVGSASAVPPPTSSSLNSKSKVQGSLEKGGSSGRQVEKSAKLPKPKMKNTKTKPGPAGSKPALKLSDNKVAMIVDVTSTNRFTAISAESDGFEDMEEEDQ